MAGTFELYRDKAGGFRFRLKAANGEIVLSSEAYTAKASAKTGIASVQKNCTDAKCFAKTETRAGKHRFNLKARNHAIIGTSQSYDSASARDKGIAAVGRAAKGAKTKDLTVRG